MSNQEVELGDYVYDLGAMIAKGPFSFLYECRHKTRANPKLCIKIIQKDFDIPLILSETQVMEILITASQGNPNIVKVEHVVIQPDKNLFILERCDGDLQQQLDKKKKNGETFHPVQALEIIKQIIHGYKILFVNNIIHRDMKPANILFKGDVYKIAGFGLARVFDSQQKQELEKVGTPKYAAPQIFHEQTFTNSADIYSIGIMFYELIYGTVPYKVLSLQDVRRATKAIKNTPIKLDMNKPGLTSEICDLIESMLMYSEEERITWPGLFEHPLIKQDDGGNNKLLQINENSDENKPPQALVQQQAQQTLLQEPQQIEQAQTIIVKGGPSAQGQTEQPNNQFQQ